MRQHAGAATRSAAIIAPNRVRRYVAMSRQCARRRAAAARPVSATSPSCGADL